MKPFDLNCILVDDEPHAIQLMRKVLELFPNNIRVIGEAHDLPSAIKLINQLNPQVVFMDINMPNYSGLQVNDFFDENRDFKLVYVTAYSEHAIEALRIQAFDYIMKPVEEEQLSRCIARLNATIGLQEETQSIADTISGNEKKLAIHSHQGVAYIAIQDIQYIEASGMYCIINTLDNQTIVSKPLKEFDYLDNSGFYRIHRSYLINTQKVKKLSKVDINEVELSNGQRLPISRTKKDDFVQFMKQSFGVGI